MKGTRLWQAPGSPIIQGRSRTARAFWEMWLIAALMAGALVAAGFAAGFRGSGYAFGSALSTGSSTQFLLGVAGSALGACIGVWLSRTMGWRRQWLSGAAIGALAAAITLLVL